MNKIFILIFSLILMFGNFQKCSALSKDEIETYIKKITVEEIVNGTKNYILEKPYHTAAIICVSIAHKKFYEKIINSPFKGAIILGWLLHGFIREKDFGWYELTIAGL